LIRVIRVPEESGVRWGQGLLVAPHFQGKVPSHRFRLVHHRTNTAPPVLLVEAGRAIVSNRARQPRRLNAVGGKAGLSVRDQRGGNASAAGLRRDEELIQLVLFDDGESKRRERRTDDADVGESGLQTIPEAVECPELGQSSRHDRRVRFVPAVVPDTRQVIDFIGLGVPRVHADRISQSAAGERQAHRGHLLAIADQNDVADEGGMIPRLAFDRFESRELLELIRRRADQRQLAVL